jgi:hypothetical protein
MFGTISFWDFWPRQGGDYMATGKQAAKDAGKVLADPKATPAEKKSAASDLAQTPSKGKK